MGHADAIPQPGPCADCELADICRVGLACAAFATFVATANVRPNHYAGVSQIPTRAIYRAIYGERSPLHRTLTAAEWRRIRAAHQRERRRQDPDRARAELMQWRAKNRDAYNSYQRARRARIRTEQQPA